jgi:hypothetical protein
MEQTNIMAPRAKVPCALFAVLAIFLAATWAAPVSAQSPGEEGATKAPSNADANNPLAKFQAFNIHDYYTSSLTEMDDQNANTFWLRYAQPFGKWLFRASLPVSRMPTGDGTATSGLGDFNAFAAYQFDLGKPGVSFGVGPLIVAPTASEDETGSGRWQGGLSAILFNAQSSAYQWGGLVTWQTDFAGDDDRPGTNVLAVQPFYFIQLGKGLYVRSSAIMVFNLETHSYNVPVGLGLGKVVPTGGAVFNIFVEPQFTILDRGAGQPELQVFVGLNTQFVGK